MNYYGFRPYVSVADRQVRAKKVAEKLRKNGSALAPIVLEGTKISKNFWGKSWCDNLERYSDYASRLPRGRSYLRHGQVIDLQIERGKVRALVHGSETYTVDIQITTVPAPRWKMICESRSGSIGSVVELLQGKLSKNVMERICREGDGLFPAPKEIKLSCSCPDWASMCKHVAATLYGVGARLDGRPELLFTLRGVDRADLIGAATELSMPLAGAGSDRVIADDDIAALFGIEMGSISSITPKAAAKTKDPAATIRAEAPKAKAIAKVKATKAAAAKADPPKAAAKTKALMVEANAKAKTKTVTPVASPKRAAKAVEKAPDAKRPSPRTAPEATSTGRNPRSSPKSAGRGGATARAQ